MEKWGSWQELDFPNWQQQDIYTLPATGMASKELYHLLRILDERDIALGRDDVAWAFDSLVTRDEVRSWVQEYLTPACLLSKDELRLSVHKIRLTRGYS